MSDDSASTRTGIWNLQDLIGDVDPTPPVAVAPPIQHPPPPPDPPLAGPVPRHTAPVPLPYPLGSVVAQPVRRFTPAMRWTAAAVLLGMVAVTVVIVRDVVRRNPSPGDPGPVATVAVPAVPVPVPTAATTDPTPGPTQSGADPDAAALRTLTDLRAQDQSVVHFDGRYAAQLASKTSGIVDQYQTAGNGTHTFSAADILAEHLGLRQADNLGAQVVLVLSTDYGHRQLYQGQPLWVTFALGDFPSGDAVTAWCATRFPQLSGAALTNQCIPRRLEPPGA